MTAKFEEEWNTIKDKGLPKEDGCYFVCLRIEKGPWWEQEHSVEIQNITFKNNEWQTDRKVIAWQTQEKYSEIAKKYSMPLDN